MRPARASIAPALVVQLRGGLGNQLFQYAAGRALSLRNHIPVWIDTTSGFRGDRYGRSYDLGAFKINPERAGAELAQGLGVRAELLRRFIGRRELWRMKVFGRYFDPAIYNLRVTRPTVINAYCQSPRYFSEISDQVRKELEFKEIPAGLTGEAVKHIEKSNSICLHIRRLYAKEVDGSSPQSVANYFGTRDIAYYCRAIRKIAAVHGQLDIFIFSDDIHWAQEHARAFKVAACRVTVICDTDPLRSFFLMRLCKHFIITNSTFGWWAAWLGNYSMKTVCIPSVWNRGDRHFPSDLFPSGWGAIPNLENTDERVSKLQSEAQLS